MPTLGINPDKVCYLISRVRQFQAKVAPLEPDPASNMVDDEFREVLEDSADDAVLAEIREFFDALNEEEYRNILSLLWLGRGDYGKEEWEDILAEAQALGAEHGPDDLIGTPLLAEHLEEGLNLLGYACEGADGKRTE
jgi:hypothetical protein